MRKKMVVFGGSFNPPTNAHFALAEHISQLPEVEAVLFVPVGDLYQKDNLIRAKFRVEMLCEVIRNNPKFQISLVEVNARKLMNTIDTMRELQIEYPEYDLYFLMGSDNLEQFPDWDGARELVEEFQFVVVSRNGQDVQNLLETSELLSENKEKFLFTEDFVGTDISSTAIRKLLREGKSVKYLVPEEIHNYLAQGSLYQVK